MSMIFGDRNYRRCENCGVEVCDGDSLMMFSWENDTICEDCLQDRVDEMSLTEKAALLGSERII